MSNRLTFSLASLILILGLVFVTAPAMAAINRSVDLGSALDDTAANTDNATITQPDLSTTATAIPANGYLLLIKTSALADAGLPSLPASSVVVGQWANMPDLEELFFDDAGGTIRLQATKTALNGTVLVGTDYRFDHDGDDDGNAALGLDKTGTAGDGIKDGSPATATSATHPDSDPVDVATNDASITEIMWALDTRLAGGTDNDDRQWIEIYNRRNVPLPLNGLFLNIKSGRPADAADDTATKLSADNNSVTTQGRTVLDRITNISGGGWGAGLPGQNGRTITTGETAADRIDFISAYRNRGKLGKDEGSNKDHWMASDAKNIYLAGHVGTPGKAERTGPKSFTTTEIKRENFVFNEISNRADANKDYEWIELRNVSDAEKNLKNWQISIVTAKKTDKEFFNFYDKDIKVAAGGILLLVASDPSDNPNHPLAAGYNIEKGADDQANGVNKDDSPHYLVMKAAAKDENDQRGLRMADGLPDNGEFVLILRHGLDKEGKPEKLEDIAGYHPDLGENDGTLFTGLWPLVNYAKPDIALNKLEKDKVHRRQHADIDGTRTKDKKDNADHVALRDVGWTGIGYKRNAAATAANGGTPGYDNGALKSDGDAVKDGASVIISEIMASHDRSLSQWIELHNTSKMHGVNIDNWSIFIVNHSNTADGEDYAGKYSERIDLDGKIPPGQTYLIVSRRGANDTQLPAARIHNSGKKRGETILNPYGFQITLKAKTNESDVKKHETVDMVGNLGEADANSRRADAQSFVDLAWMLPTSMDDEGNRESIVRVSKKMGEPVDGMSKMGWKAFSMSAQETGVTYYGHKDDVGNPGYTYGGVLPVSLSKFRPERLKDTGEIVIRWITESELNNAGFNILRSEKRDGAFKQINTQLIKGQGTTSERSTYTWKDTTAKPNVVYYYQIQDVSLDGQVQTLRMSRLKGNVTAAGKLTTTWGELKALQ